MSKGLIISNISNLYQVEINNRIVECKPRGKMKQDEISPVVGDYVEIEELENENNKGVICNVLERSMYSKRPKLANLTQIILVISLKLPKPDLLLLDKQLIYAEHLNIKPIICINKIDLGNGKQIKEIHEVYEKIGYIVIDTNAKEKLGIDKLKSLLNNEITAFSGNSGVGKSTLINSLFGENKTEEGLISKKNQRGKNTTTSVTLYKVDDGYIADTPGFSTFSVEEIESKELSKYFVEFKEYINNCEYADCEHEKEENCGIKQALKIGKLDMRKIRKVLQNKSRIKRKGGT